MIALDTNVLVRFLVEDDEVQTARAAKVIDRAIAAGERLFISDVVLCELVWVLTTSYRLSRATVAETLRRLLGAKHLHFAEAAFVRALEAYAGGKGDFADYVIREHARAAGCSRVATFDRGLLKERDFFAP